MRGGKAILLSAAWFWSALFCSGMRGTPVAIHVAHAGCGGRRRWRRSRKEREASAKLVVTGFKILFWGRFVNSAVSNRQAVAAVVVAVGNSVLRDADRAILIQTPPLADIRPASNAIAILMTSAARRLFA